MFVFSSMPVIFRHKGFAFFFVMFDLNEPVHIHIRHGRKEAKYWVEPLTLAWNHGCRPHELNEIERLIEEKRNMILSTWQEELRK